MSVINTNITSMIGQQNLRESQNALQTSMERLSSGLRINSAKDDAAGQAIANRMSAQITGLGQAQRNANDGISVAQTAEGGLNQINDNLQRIRELSVQAANGTNSANDLQSIQDEINQRLSEIDRVSEQTDFNGTKVLASDNALQIQVGANDGETISVNLEKINSSELGLSGFTVAGPGDNVGNVDASDLQAEFGSTTALTATTVTDSGFDAGLLASFNQALGADSLSGAAGDIFTTNGQVQSDDNGNTYFAVDVTANSDADDLERLRSLGFELADATSSQTVYIAADLTDGTQNTTNLEFTLNSADGQALSPNELLAPASDNPMKKLDDALNQVDSLRSELGAVQNRFEDAITNLSTNETNLSAARSRIEDANYAVEVADMTKNQILQQAGTSVLAQANQLPQNVLSLLG
ncbi:FliC/FljB family flagellin [Halomonas alkaliantarctica]|nr:FliC/FljB family flagellin [Halomonas alkaliantarctica]